MIIKICDYCNEQGRYHLHRIPLSRRPNDEPLVAELCDTCLSEIKAYDPAKGTKV